MSPGVFSLDTFKNVADAPTAREIKLMRTLLLYALFFASGCSTLGARQPSSHESEKVLLTLDAHVHVEAGKGYEGALSNQFLGHSFLISSSYNINSSKSFPNRSLNDQEVSKISTRYPLKFSGLCGVNLSWPDVADILAQCLNMPGMVGAKIHDLAEPDGLVEKDKFKALREVINIMKSRDSLLLWHIKSDPAVDRGKLAREIKEIVDNASLNGNIYFILAHAVDSLDPTLHLRMVVDAMKPLKKRPKNLFIELSGTMDICENEPQKEKINLWKDFGFDYILLGSDSSSRSWPGQAMLEEELSVIKTSDISESSKEKILISNGLKILRTVNPLAYEDISRKVSISPINIKELNTHTCKSLEDLVQSLTAR